MPSPNACRGLRLRARERGRQRIGRVDAPDAAPAAARGGLDHQREADARRVAQRLLDGRDRAAAPGRDRDAGLLGEPLGGDLVADEAHDRRVGADEHDAQALAQLGELGSLGDEAPADPGRVARAATSARSSARGRGSRCGAAVAR